MNKKRLGTTLIIAGILSPFIATPIGTAAHNDIAGVLIGLILFVALVFLGANLRGTSKKALIVIVVVFLLGTVAALAFAHYQHQTIATDRCLQNLAQIDAAKIIWFGDNGSNAIPSLKDLKDGYPTYRATFASTEPFQIWGTNGQPVCPAGGTYTVGKTGEPPSCSIHGTATWSSWCDQHPHRY